jgi:tetratricopeptide (TPR) repeat protein
MARRTGGRRKNRDEENKDDRLVVGDRGITFTSGGRRATVRYDDCVACLVWDAEVGLWSSDGFYVFVDPVEWREGEEAVARVRDAPLDPRVVVRPPFEDEELAEALDAFGREEWERAIELLESGLARVPAEPHAWRLLTYAYGALGRTAHAIRAARNAVELDPPDAWAATAGRAP